MTKSPASTRFDIRSFGAIGDGQILNTQAVQAAIDACHQAGGGQVIVAQGRYLIGTIVLKSHVNLHIEGGATLLGSIHQADYPKGMGKQVYKNEAHMDPCLIFAREATGFSITGNGEIDGQGHFENFPGSGNRPMMLRFINCRKIRLRDLTLRNPAAWTSAWLYCEEIAVDGICIHSIANHNGDGLDFDGCQDVRVNNCSFTTSDDSICLQTSRIDNPCRDIVINNCTMRSKWAAIRIGLLSMGDFENVTVSNCIFRDIEDAGLKIQMCEGAVMKNMIFSDIIMVNVPRPIFMTFCQQRAGVDSPETLRPMNYMGDMLFNQLLIDNRVCDQHAGILITGMPDHPIENIRLQNITMHLGGGGTATEAARNDIPEYTPEVLEDWWPEYHLLNGAMPAHGLYARHVRGLELSQLQFTTQADDAREAIVCEDVARFDHNHLKTNGDPIQAISHR